MIIMTKTITFEYTNLSKFLFEIRKLLPHGTDIEMYGENIVFAAWDGFRKAYNIWGKINDRPEECVEKREEKT